MTQWWRVTHHTGQVSFPVLVVDGRVAAISSEFKLVAVGDRWDDVRRDFEADEAFTCTMETL
jgi:hypothetical protein